MLVILFSYIVQQAYLPIHRFNQQFNYPYYYYRMALFGNNIVYHQQMLNETSRMKKKERSRDKYNSDKANFKSKSFKSRSNASYSNSNSESR